MNSSPSEDNDASALLRVAAEELGTIFSVSDEALELSFKTLNSDSAEVPSNLSAEALWASFRSMPEGIPAVTHEIGAPDGGFDSVAEGLKIAARNGSDLSEEVRQQMESDRCDRESEES